MLRSFLRLASESDAPLKPQPANAGDVFVVTWVT
jgi:hypothetical protein